MMWVLLITPNKLQQRYTQNLYLNGKFFTILNQNQHTRENYKNTEWPKKMYTLFTHQYLWNKFKWNFYFRV